MIDLFWGLPFEYRLVVAVSSIFVGIVVLSVLLLFLGRRLYRRARKKADATQSPLSEAVAQAVFGMMQTILGVSIQSLDLLEAEVRQVQVQRLARDLYCLLPDTIRVTFRGFIVPVPIKTMCSEDDFVSLVDYSFRQTAGGLDLIESWFAAKGISEASLMRYATPAPGTIAVPPAQVETIRDGAVLLSSTPWYRWEEHETIVREGKDSRFALRRKRMRTKEPEGGA